MARIITCTKRKRRWRKANPEKAREYQRMVNLRRYGVTLENYDAMLDKQNGVCAICSKVCQTGRSLSVDHDHDTGKVRGLLCYRCNTALGCMDDDAERLRVAAEYLES